MALIEVLFNDLQVGYDSDEALMTDEDDLDGVGVFFESGMMGLGYGDFDDLEYEYNYGWD
jgi:hypothetical protein